MNQVFDYINMDDGFDNDKDGKDGPHFGASALQTNKSVDKIPKVPIAAIPEKEEQKETRERSPTTDREKYKAP
jgi:hypothetical protein